MHSKQVNMARIIGKAKLLSSSDGLPAAVPPAGPRFCWAAPNPIESPLFTTLDPVPGLVVGLVVGLAVGLPAAPEIGKTFGLDTSSPTGIGCFGVTVKSTALGSIFLVFSTTIRAMILSLSSATLAGFAFSISLRADLVKIYTSTYLVLSGKVVSLEPRI